MGEVERRRKYSKDVPAEILQTSEGLFLKLYHEFINVSIESKDAARTLFLLCCQGKGIENILDIEPVTVRKYIHHIYEDRGRKSAAKVAYFGTKNLFQPSSYGLWICSHWWQPFNSQRRLL